MPHSVLIEPPQPTDLYGKTKAECERRIQTSALRWSILRIAVCPPTELSFKDAGGFELIFDTSASGRIEVVHNDDAALAFANAVNCDEAIGKILFIGGGETCRCHVMFQRHGLDDIFSDLKDNIGFKRWLLRIAAPLVTPLLERRSPHRARA